MTEVLTNYEQKPVGRPTFLTVLCILTFIGSGWAVISNTMAYFAANSQSAMISTIKESAQSDIQKSATTDASQKLADQMVSNLSVLSPENIKKSALGGIVAAVLCLIGAFMMWGLKKTGFYTYVLGTLVGVVAPIVIYGAGNIFGLLSTVGIAFLGIIFVVLYGLNLKHMR